MENPWATSSHRPRYDLNLITDPTLLSRGLNEHKKEKGATTTFSGRWRPATAYSLAYHVGLAVCAEKWTEHDTFAARSHFVNRKR